MTPIWSTRGQHSTLGQLKTIGLLKLSRLCLLAGLPRWLFLHATACLTAVAVVVAYGNHLVQSTRHTKGVATDSFEYQSQPYSNVVFERNDVAFTFANGTILMLNNETIFHPTSNVQLTTLVDDAVWAFSCKRELWRDAPPDDTRTRWIQHDGRYWLLHLADQTTRPHNSSSALLLTHAGAWLIYRNKLWQMSDPHLRLISQQQTALYKSRDTWRFTNDSYHVNMDECFGGAPMQSFLSSEEQAVRAAYSVRFTTLMLI
jgi:hypothetical protein